ncbi:hypothetical protein [Methyloceanibacter sp.]|uniref:hypothetical protein n=1 Tax=Methyloceanibacter sp. TaxID=1965321 RepID=UPI00351AD86D
MASKPSTMQTVASCLKQTLPAKLVDELLAAYEEAKQNFYLGGLRLSAVEGGRFCEAAFRLLEHITTGKSTPLNKQLDTDILALSNLPTAASLDSIRIHIPRALRVVYDIRNKRDAAHLADGIDPNLQDATLVVSVLDWVTAEFVRIYHGVTADEAQSIIETLVTRQVPSVQDFDGFMEVLNTNLKASEYVLLILYERGTAGATYDEIESWVHPSMRANLQRTLRRLTDDHAYIHSAKGKYLLTKSGAAEVERKKLHATDT